MRKTWLIAMAIVLVALVAVLFATLSTSNVG